MELISETNGTPMTGCGKNTGEMGGGVRRHLGWTGEGVRWEQTEGLLKVGHSASGSATLYPTLSPVPNPQPCAAGNKKHIGVIHVYNDHNKVPF